MLAMNSPEVYQENMLFEGPSGQLLRQLTYSNGAKHLFEVDEVTGKQTHISRNTVLAQQNAEQIAATASQAEQEVAPIIPYTAHFIPTVDPTSISQSVIEPAGKQVRVAIPSLERKTETKASTERPSQPDVRPEGMSAAGVVEPSTLAVLGLAVVARSGKGWFNTFADKTRSFNDRALAFSQRQKDKMSKYYNTDNRDKNNNRKLGTAAVAGVVAIAVLLGFGSCIANDDSESVPETNPTTAPEKPGVNDNGTGKDAVTDKQKKNTELPTSVNLRSGEVVWGVAHELLESRGYNHKNPNTAAITNAMRNDMGISEAEARRLAVNTKVPLYTDKEIEDILDDFGNTTPNKIKK